MSSSIVEENARTYKTKVLAFENEIKNLTTGECRGLDNMRGLA